MRNCKPLRNLPLYLLAVSNLVLGVNRGFTWVTWLAVILAAIVFILDIWEALHHGN